MTVTVKTLAIAVVLSSVHSFAPIAFPRRNTFVATLSSQPASFVALFETEASKNDGEPNDRSSSSSAPPGPELLKPFPPAADPMYASQGPVGEGDFIVSREGGPTKEELSNENLYKIVMVQCSDLEVNTLVWKCLGYRFRPEERKWYPDDVFPNWKEKFPAPPDLIGMQRLYTKEIDRPCLKANQQLVRSVPVEHKQSLKLHLKPIGFSGYKYAELTPNKTRRAQCTNWLLYYREVLFGFTLDELREQKRLSKQAEEDKRLSDQGSKQSTDNEWKPPVTEVF